tara:strand:+ start:1226 stop:1399 length:174 start_codon:yes stop_codon:yes gene_type:complete
MNTRYLEWNDYWVVRHSDAINMSLGTSGMNWLEIAVENLDINRFWGKAAQISLIIRE